MVRKNTIHPLQSPEWADFRKKWGNEVIQTPYGYITLHKIPLTKFKIGAFIKGPEPTQEMFSWFKKFGKDNNLIFVKFEPNIKKDDSLISKLQMWGAVSGKTLFTPSTFWIDITPNEEDLLKSFSSKTRYNIRLAQRHGVEIIEDTSKNAFENYWKLHNETTNRQGFYSHTKKYHELMWDTLHSQMIKDNKEPIAHMLSAKYKGETIATWVVFVYDNFLYYPYGGSTSKYKNIMANNLMMWEAIKFGRKNNLRTFDLWGREDGKGFTKFKEGYNPKVIEFLGTWDLIINKPIYWLYRFAESIRWRLLRIKSRLFAK